MIALRVLRLPHGQGLPLPAYQTPGAAGMDLPAALDSPLTLDPGARAVIPTGLAMEIPPGHEGQIRPRSGLAVRHGLTVLNAPATIDCDYRGELQIPLINLGQEPITLRRGDRIAQLVIAPVVRLPIEEVTSLPPTTRGEGGFGSTG